MERKKILKWGSIFVMFLVLACNKQEQILFQAPKFERVVPIKGQIINDTFMIGTGGLDINYYGDILVVNAYRGDDEGRIHLFNRANGTFIKSIIKSGRGPGESVATLNLDVDAQSGNAVFYDFIMHKLILFNVDSVYMHSNCTDYIRNYVYPIYMYTVYYGKEGYIAKGGLKLDNDIFPRFSMIKHDSVIFAYSHYPQVFAKNVSNAIKTGYNSRCHVQVSPDKSKLVCASPYGAVLEIFDIDKDEITLDTIRGFVRPVFDVTAQQQLKPILHETIYGFIDIYLTNKYIYTLYNEIPFNGETESINRRQIAVFDWKGKEVCLYQSDYDLYRICVDEKANILYAIGRNENLETILLSFDLAK